MCDVEKKQKQKKMKRGGGGEKKEEGRKGGGRGRIRGGRTCFVGIPTGLISHDTILNTVSSESNH